MNEISNIIYWLSLLIIVLFAIFFGIKADKERDAELIRKYEQSKKPCPITHSENLG